MKKTSSTGYASEQQATIPHSSVPEGGVETISGGGHCGYQLITTKEELTEESSQQTSAYQLIRKTSQLNEEAKGVGNLRSGQGEHHENASAFRKREYHKYKLVDEKFHKQEDTTCLLCQLILCVPARMECCGYTYCHDCITTHSKGQGSACPQCDTKPLKWKFDQSLQDKIDSLHVHCINHNRGCRWTGDLKYAQQHLEEATDTAKAKASHANRLLFWRGTEVVTMGRCEYQPTTCKKCEEKVLYGELDDHTKNKCNYRTVPCDFQFAGCDFESSKASMVKHIQQNTSKHLTLVTKHIQEKASNYQTHETSLFPKILFACLIIVAFLVYAAHRLRGTEMQFNGINRRLESLDLYYSTQVHDIEISFNHRLMRIEQHYNSQLHSIESQLNSTKQRLVSTELAIEDASEELNRKVNSSELAIQSLQYNSRDIDSSLQRQSQKIKGLKEAVQSLQLDHHEVHEVKIKLMEHLQKMKDLESDIDTLKREVARLKSGITTSIDDLYRWVESLLPRWLQLN